MMYINEIAFGKYDMPTTIPYLETII